MSEHRHADECYGDDGKLYCAYADSVPDPIDTAIAEVEAKAAEPDHLIADFRFNDGSTMKLIVPIDFDSDKFETAIAMLMQLRLASDQRKAALNPIVVPPTRPTLVRPDGRPLS